MSIESIESELQQFQLGNAGPKYEQLRRFIAEQMNSGVIRTGDALPPEKQMAELLSLSRVTVRQALAGLERDGYIKRIHGVGTFADKCPTPTESTPTIPSSHDALTALPKRQLAAYALVLPGSPTDFYSPLHQGFDEAVTDGKHVIVCNTQNDPYRQADILLRLVYDRVAGIAIVPPTTHAPDYQLLHLQESGIPIVCCHRGTPGTKTPVLSLPYEEIGYRSAKYLLEHGHEKIAMFFSSHGSQSGQLRENGFRRAMDEVGLDLRDNMIFRGTSVAKQQEQEAAMTSALDQMMSRKNHPTAICVSYDPMAEVIYFILQKMGVRIPEDVSILSFGSHHRSGAIISRLSAITFNGRWIGQRAAELLGEMEKGIRPIDSDETIPIDLDVFEGKTVATC